MKTELIPKSRAKTAYGLLSEIRALILDEPKRYNQWDTLTMRDHVSSGARSPISFPACGTVGCVAGWTVALKSPEPSMTYGVCHFAQRQLGLSLEQADELFDAGAASGNSQTKRHAESGASHIARFQKKYRAQLLAKKV